MNDENDNSPLDLNNLPDEFSARDNGKQTQFEAGSSSSGQSSRKKKDEEKGKVYECRFCSLKFCKSQALGGHMNRHRQERETEALNKARMLVFSNENNLPTVHGLPARHLGGQQIIGGFHQQVIDPTLHFSPAYPVQPAPMRLSPSSQSSTVLRHQQIPPQPYLYQSPPQPHFLSPYRSQYHPSDDFSGGHAHGTTRKGTANYTCIGAPVGPAIHRSGNQDDELSWGMRGLEGTTPHQQLQPATPLDLSSAGAGRFHGDL